MTKRIFTFWEPKDKIPAYLELCLQSWKKYLPDYEIVILSYDNLNEWIGKDFYPDFLYHKYTLPIQADALRCAVLKKHGGIWLDLDTIITSDNIQEILSINSDSVLINKHIAFIKADKNSKVLNHWHKGISNNLKLKSLYENEKLPYLFRQFIKICYSKNLSAWDCLGNLPLKKALKTKNKKDFYKINGEQIKALPEVNYKKENSLELDFIENYKNFYFYNDYSDYVINCNKGIILLHNSWTPKEFYEMSKEEFLNSKNTLSEIFHKVI